MYDLWVDLLILQTLLIYLEFHYYAELKVNHIYRNVQKFYCKVLVKSVLFDFKDIPSDVKSKLTDTYCLDLYGSQLWKYNKNDVNTFYIAWR